MRKSVSFSPSVVICTYPTLCYWERPSNGPSSIDLYPTLRFFAPSCHYAVIHLTHSPVPHFPPLKNPQHQSLLPSHRVHRTSPPPFVSPPPRSTHPLAIWFQTPSSQHLTKIPSRNRDSPPPCLPSCLPCSLLEVFPCGCDLLAVVVPRLDRASPDCCVGQGRYLDERRGFGGWGVGEQRRKGMPRPCLRGIS